MLLLVFFPVINFKFVIFLRFDTLIGIVLKQGQIVVSL